MLVHDGDGDGDDDWTPSVTMSTRVAVGALLAESIAPRASALPFSAVPCGMASLSTKLEEDQLVGVDGDGEA